MFHSPVDRHRHAPALPTSRSGRLDGPLSIVKAGAPKIFTGPDVLT